MRLKILLRFFGRENFSGRSRNGPLTTKLELFISSPIGAHC